MKEKEAGKINGLLGVTVILFLTGFSIYLGISDKIFLGLPALVFVILLASGITVVQPNQARVLTLFGRYVGSVRESGIWLTIPLTKREKVTLRVRNFHTNTLKVNDIEGNPIEIAAVVVFKVIDSAKATFDVDNYEQFVEIQSEAALRYVATKYPYDAFDEGGHSLRGNTDDVAAQLGQEIQDRLSVAGVKVIEARLTHLAYATEIASAMLQRQQASAVVAARQKIVEGAVGMAQTAIQQLQQEGIVDLDEERKVAMINNLMVAIVSDRAAQPVINTGSLY